MPSLAPGAAGQGLGQIDSSSNNQGKPPGSQGGPSANAPFSKETISRNLLKRSQGQLQQLLNRWIANRDERALVRISIFDFLPPLLF